jgi:hypothetical protein
MLGDPRSRSKVWEAPDREIGKPGEKPRPDSRELGVSTCGSFPNVTRLMENLRNLESRLALLLVSHDNDVIRYADDVYEIENGLAVRLARIDDTLTPGTSTR